MSRNAEEGFFLYEELFNKGINLIFLKEPHINTDTYRKAVESKLQIAFNSGDGATDELMQGYAARVYPCFLSAGNLLYFNFSVLLFELGHMIFHEYF